MAQASLSEAEIKVELTDQEVVRVKDSLLAIGFEYVSHDTLQEYYLTKDPSPLGGWDFERLRVVSNHTFLYTVKKWVQDKNGNAVRLEDEKSISQEDFTQLTNKGYALHYTKEREDFKGTIDGNKMTVSIDTLVLDNQKKYFLECEIIVEQEKSHDAREFLKNWMQSTLKVSTLHEAPSMIDIVSGFSKSE